MKASAPGFDHTSWEVQHDCQSHQESTGNISNPTFGFSAEGLNNGAAFCGKVSSYGGLAMRANPGKFKGMLSLQFYIKGSDNSSMPTISVKIASDLVRFIDMFYE